MSFFQRKKLSTGEIPVVPNDKAERVESLARNKRKLVEAVDSIPRTKLVVDSLNAHKEINHYALRLSEAYGGDQ